MRPLAFGLILMVLWLCAGFISLRADDAPPQVTATLEAKEDAWVGQKVTLAIELLAPGYFSGVPHFDYPQVPGVLIVPSEEHPTVGTRQIGDQSYTVQRYETALFARRAGTFTVPPFKVRFGLKRSPLDHDATLQDVTTPAVNFTAKLPPGAEKLTTLISARDLVIAEKWVPQPQACKVGDAFTRTITYTASDVPGMAFPPIPVAKIDGLAIYAKPPLVEDESDRGELQGKITQTITYICQRSGHFTVPALQFTWWNTGTQKLEIIAFRAREFEVAALPGSVRDPEAKAEIFPFDVKWVVGGFLVVVTLGGLLFALPSGFFRRVLSPLRPVHLQPLNPACPALFSEEISARRERR